MLVLSFLKNLANFFIVIGFVYVSCAVPLSAGRILTELPSLRHFITWFGSFLVVTSVFYSFLSGFFDEILPFLECICSAELITSKTGTFVDATAILNSFEKVFLNIRKYFGWPYSCMFLYWGTYTRIHKLH